MSLFIKNLTGLVFLIHIKLIAICSLIILMLRPLRLIVILQEEPNQ
jgi:hypothetical protein